MKLEKSSNKKGHDRCFVAHCSDRCADLGVSTEEEVRGGALQDDQGHGEFNQS